MIIGTRGQSRRAETAGPGALLARHGAALLFAVVVALIGLELDRRDLALVDTLDKHLGDRRIAYFSPRASDQREDIAIVLVTEETLLDYESRSPIDRGLLAEIVRAIDRAGPRAIALDFIFDRPTAVDQRLIAAIRGTRAPVILGAMDARGEGSDLPVATRVGLERQKIFLAAAGRPYGHLMLERKQGFLTDTDTTVRYVANPLPHPGAPEAFADVIARAVGKTQKPQSNTIAWLRSPASHDLFLTIDVPRHAPGAVKPGLAGLLPPAWDEQLKGRVVIVGARMLDRDLHRTPLAAVEGTHFPGVMIHAQAVAQRLDDGTRDIRVWPWWLTLLVVSGVALACFHAAELFRFDPQGIAFGLVGLVAIGTLSVIAFAVYRIDIPSIALATAWVAGGLGGFVSGWLTRSLAGGVSEAED
jgi:CHASE2 domain-containing sensor protein